MNLDELCNRAELAIRLGATDYSIAVCQHILRYLPRHIQARSLLGQAFLEQGAQAKAAEQFKAVLEVDPDNVLARSALGVVYERLGELSSAIEQFERAYQISPANAEVADGLRQLYAQRDGAETSELKLPTATLARLHNHKKQYSSAVQEFDEVLKTQPGHVELQLARAEALWRGGMLREAERACLQILQKAPQTLKAKLILAEIMIRDRSREKQGAALLHEALGVDPGGKLIKGLFKDTSFIVPDPSADLDFPPPNGGIVAPPEVETALSLLPKSAALDVDVDPSPVGDLDLEDAMAAAAPKGVASPEVLRVLTDLERLREGLLERPRRETEAPGQVATAVAEAIVTSKKRLIAKYGNEAFERLDRKLQEYVKSLASVNIAARILYVDDQASAEQHGLSPVDPSRAEMVKAMIDQMDQNLAQGGQELTYVLILGGDSIIPFFRMRNSTEDDDEHILTDNPYASRDADFISPERALGRMPDAEGADISFLLGQLSTAMTHRHEPSPKSQPLGCLAALLSLGIRVKLPQLPAKSVGYSALVWKEASASVFGAIDDPRNLLTSPPTLDEEFDAQWLLGSSFNYFNLHGAKDSEFWYGQKDLTYPDDYPMLPIALSPRTISEASVASSVIFSEACYGAQIVGRSPHNSIALQFLAGGALGFVGSTVTSYGVPSPPLANADLMAIHFWHNLAEGLSLGQALTRAKITLMNETTERQGWLDGDDQKTLLEFVLYGDPSSHFDKVPSLRTKGIYEPALRHARTAERRHAHIFCQHRMTAREEADLPVDLIHRVVSHLHSCCPEVHGSSVKIHSCVSCNGQCGIHCQCGAGTLHSHDVKEFHKLTHFTSRKPLRTLDGREITKYARATVGPSGEIIKTTLSR